MFIYDYSYTSDEAFECFSFGRVDLTDLNWEVGFHAFRVNEVIREVNRDFP